MGQAHAKLFRSDRRGAVTLVFAASSIAMLAMAGLVIDAGTFSARNAISKAPPISPPSPQRQIWPKPYRRQTRMPPTTPTPPPM